MWSDAEHFAKLVEEFPENQWTTDFVEKKLGSYYSNVLGLIEHTHYHLGQIVILKKIIERSK
jgi:hypothetical protein